MLSSIMAVLPEINSLHARSNELYKFIDKITIDAIQNSELKSTVDGSITLGPYGNIKLPFYKMGAITTLDLFGLDELIIFSFYWINRKIYKNSVDIGANLGLHSILMSRCGWDVTCYEPDPIHVKLLRRNLDLNNIKNTQVKEEAVSDNKGTLEFIRVLGNTTGSHIAGAKTKPYGELERFPVKVEAIGEIMKKADLIKLDAEGQEKIILLATNSEQWDLTDMILEVGSQENAIEIFNHMTQIGVNLFSQKLNWGKVNSIDGMPSTYKQGSLFLSKKATMPW